MGRSCDGLVGSRSNQFVKQKYPRPGGAKSDRTNLDVEVPRLIYEDRQATIACSERGASKAVGHLQRTRRVNTHWLSEVIGLVMFVSVTWIRFCRLRRFYEGIFGSA